MTEETIRPILSERELRQKGYHQISRVPIVFALKKREDRHEIASIYIEQRQREDTYFCCYFGLSKYVGDLDFSRVR